MRKLIFNARGIATFILLVFLVSACMKDKVSSTYTYKMYKPVYKSLAEVRANMKSQAATPLENTGKIYVKGNYIFLNELNKGIHVIDNSDPVHPRNASFISIPGNVDIAVKGSTLYADSWADLVAFDISNPLDVHVSKILDTVFRENLIYYTNYGLSDSVIVDYIVKDTTVPRLNTCINCEYMYEAIPAALNASAGKSNGTGGSMARFTAINNYLYTVNYSNLNVIDISTASNPSLSKRIPVSWTIETIYPFQDKLFLGSASGMFIFDISAPDQPTQIGQFGHVRACDPVITDGKYAYVTLSSGSLCGGSINELQIADVSNLSSPLFLKSYSLTQPQGLAKDGNTLFVCDGKAGLKVYDASDEVNLRLVNTLSGGETYDVIAGGGLAIVVASDGLYQYSYNNQKGILPISKLSINH